MSERIYDPLSIAEQDDLFNQMGKWLRDNPKLPPREFLTCEIENLYRMRATIYQLETENARLIERVRELERLGLFDHRAAAIESQKRADAAEAQLAAANERVRELERRERIADTIADAATGGAMNNLDRAMGLESQLAAANERIAGLEKLGIAMLEYLPETMREGPRRILEAK